MSEGAPTNARSTAPASSCRAAGCAVGVFATATLAGVAASPYARLFARVLRPRMRTNFEPGRSFANKLDYQLQLDEGCAKANARVHGTTRAVVAERLAEERERMRPLPERMPDPDRRFVIRVPAQPYLRFDTNGYSLDPRLIGSRVGVRVSQSELTAVALDTGELAGRHRRRSRATSHGQQVLANAVMELVVSSVPEGWYPDPRQPTKMRYWDGTQWTEHVQARHSVAQVAASWYPDPQQPGWQRYWDGSQWTDQVRSVPLFDGELVVSAWSSKKKQRLVVTPEEMWWGDAHVRWDDLAWFGQRITVARGYETEFEVDLRLNDGEIVSVLYYRHSKRDHTPRRAYDAIIEQLRTTVGDRMMRGLLRMVDEGQPVRVGGLMFSPEGFSHEGKGQAPIPWRDYARVEVRARSERVTKTLSYHQSIIVELFRITDRGKPKGACQVTVDLMRAWAIPPLAEEHARRYAAA
jgi:hypothetical protein